MDDFHFCMKRPEPVPKENMRKMIECMDAETTEINKIKNILCINIYKIYC